MKSRSRASAPSTVKRTVPPGRLPNPQYRTREYLTEREVDRLVKAAGNNPIEELASQTAIAIAAAAMVSLG
jgi:hypothetical protein